MMNLTAPLVFEPLFMERVWGGRRLEQLFGKKLPPGARIGESWEIVDRPEAQSVVHSGELRGRTLHQLWTENRAEIFGENSQRHDERFPLLIKLLDAQDRLSVQVHPPTSVAGELHGEPKSEMWYFASTQPQSDIFVGLKKGVTREVFERALADGGTAELLHRIRPEPGDAIFIPSGRVHAIGTGNVIVEIQQNSDTTYRVFDWNRPGLDGQPRALHLDESLRSMDFSDIEPPLARPHGELLVECDFFRVEKWALSAAREACAEGEFAIFCCLEGNCRCGGKIFSAGDTFLIPASLQDREIEPVSSLVTLLRTTIPTVAGSANYTISPKQDDISAFW